MTGFALLALLLKMALVAAIVVAAAHVTERTRPAFGALIATLPLSLGPSYVLVALDHDAAFLADAVLAGIASAGATSAFVALFALLLVRLPLPAALAMALIGWVLAAFPVYAADWSIAGAVLFSAAILGIARAATQSLRGYRPAGPAHRTRWDVPLRAALVALFVGVLAAVSSVIGPSGVGTLANFPIIMSSVGVIMTLSHGPRAAAAVLANSVDGMAGIVVAMVAMRLSVLALGPAAALTLGLGICVAWNALLFTAHRIGSRNHKGS